MKRYLIDWYTFTCVIGFRERKYFWVIALLLCLNLRFWVECKHLQPTIVENVAINAGNSSLEGSSTVPAIIGLFIESTLDVIHAYEIYGTIYSKESITTSFFVPFTVVVYKDNSSNENVVDLMSSMNFPCDCNIPIPQYASDANTISIILESLSTITPSLSFLLIRSFSSMKTMGALAAHAMDKTKIIYIYEEKDVLTSSTPSRRNDQTTESLSCSAYEKIILSLSTMVLTSTRQSIKQLHSYYPLPPSSSSSSSSTTTTTIAGFVSVLSAPLLSSGSLWPSVYSVGSLSTDSALNTMIYLKIHYFNPETLNIKLNQMLISKETQSTPTSPSPGPKHKQQEGQRKQPYQEEGDGLGQTTVTSSPLLSPSTTTTTTDTDTDMEDTVGIREGPVSYINFFMRSHILLYLPHHHYPYIHIKKNNNNNNNNNNNIDSEADNIWGRTIMKAIKCIAKLYPEMQFIWIKKSHIYPMSTTTYQKQQQQQLSLPPNIRLVRWLSYRYFISVLDGAMLVITTDPQTAQQAAYLGIPCILPLTTSVDVDSSVSGQQPGHPCRGENPHSCPLLPCPPVLSYPGDEGYFYPHTSVVQVHLCQLTSVLRRLLPPHPPSQPPTDLTECVTEDVTDSDIDKCSILGDCQCGWESGEGAERGTKCSSCFHNRYPLLSSLHDLSRHSVVFGDGSTSHRILCLLQHQLQAQHQGHNRQSSTGGSGSAGGDVEYGDKMCGYHQATVDKEGGVHRSYFHSKHTVQVLQQAGYGQGGGKMVRERAGGSGGAAWTWTVVRSWEGEPLVMDPETTHRNWLLGIIPDDTTAGSVCGLKDNWNATELLNIIHIHSYHHNDGHHHDMNIPRIHDDANSHNSNTTSSDNSYRDSYGMNSNSSSSSSKDHGSGNRLFCGVFTMATRHNNAKAQRNSWGKRCDGWIAFSTTNHFTLAAVSVWHEGGESYRNMWQKIRSVWKYIHRNYAHRFDWFLLGGDDMYVIVDNLRAYLRSEAIQAAHQSNQGLYLGRRVFREQGFVYNTGESGYLLNRKALHTLIAHIDSRDCFAHEQVSWEDVYIGNCLHLAGVTAFDTRDRQGMHRFHYSSPGVVWLEPTPPWYFENYTGYDPNKIYEAISSGFDCCAPSSVSFHNIQAEDMAKIHSYLYHCPRPLVTR